MSDLAWIGGSTLSSSTHRWFHKLASTVNHRIVVADWIDSIQCSSVKRGKSNHCWPIDRTRQSQFVSRCIVH